MTRNTLSSGRNSSQMEESLGKKLVAAREAAGISIDDAVYRAKMPRAVVEALEADDFGYFSSPLYARSFLKQYSDYVGADVEAWLDDFVPTVLIDGADTESFIDISDHTPIKKAPSKQRNSGGAMSAVWMIVITCAVVWLGVKGFAYIEKAVANEESAALESKEDPTEEAEAEAVAENTPTAQEPAPLATEESESPAVSTAPEPPRRAIIVEIEEEE